MRVHDEERPPRGGVFARRVDADDAGHIAERGERARFGGEASTQRRVAGAFREEELHGAVDAERLVAREPHLSHPARANAAEEVQRADGASVRHRKKDSTNGIVFSIGSQHGPGFGNPL